MNSSFNPQRSKSADEKWDRLALTLAAVVLALRIGFASRLGLGDDEAYYWDWIHPLSLSYFDHPGMTAWLIALGTAIFGDTPFGVRFFGLICNALSIWLLWRMAVDLFDRKVAALSLVLFLFSPIFVVGGLLMVPDAPMAAAWMFLIWTTWQILKRFDAGEKIQLKLWIFAGLAVGLGFLSKYTMLLAAFSSVMVLAFSEKGRRAFSSRGFWTAISIAAYCSLPVILWNDSLGWPSLKYHLAERQAGGGGANFTRWMQYFVSQALAIGPTLFPACIGILFLGMRRWAEPKWRFITCMSLPPLLIFTLQALFAEFKPHWPAPAYPLLFVGLCAWFCEGNKISLAKKLLAASIVAFCILVNGLFYVDAVKPILPKLARRFAPQIKWDPKFDPINDLSGWSQAIQQARRIHDDLLNSGGGDAFLSSYRYQLVAQMAFASGERVWRIGDGKDQYTFTQTPEELADLRGRPSIFITDQRFERDPRGDGHFESCEEKSILRVSRQVELARIFHIWLCRGYRGS